MTFRRKVIRLHCKTFSCKCSNTRKRAKETNRGDDAIPSPPKTKQARSAFETPCLGAPQASHFLFHTKTTEDGGFDFYVSWSPLSGGDRPTVCSRTTSTLTPSAAVTHIGIILNGGLCWAAHVSASQRWQCTTTSAELCYLLTVLLLSRGFRGSGVT